jgi:endonuclease-3
LLRLHQTYPIAECALDFRSPYQLLVATILSAQCTDERVNKVTPALFARYPTPADLAAAEQSDVEELVRSTGFFRNKAKNLIGMARGLVADHAGRVPKTMEELVKLPGVARKTANVVLGTAFHIPSGVVVDTHVTRISRLLGLTKHKDPVKIERDLVELLPEEEWITFSHMLILHGRQVCVARRPACDRCTLAKLCPSATKR